MHFNDQFAVLVFNFKSLDLAAVLPFELLPWALQMLGICNSQKQIPKESAVIKCDENYRILGYGEET